MTWGGASRCAAAGGVQRPRRARVGEAGEWPGGAGSAGRRARAGGSAAGHGGGPPSHQVCDLGRGTGDLGVTQFGVAWGNAPLFAPTPNRTPGPRARRAAKDVRGAPAPSRGPGPAAPRAPRFSAPLPAWRGCWVPVGGARGPSPLPPPPTPPKTGDPQAMPHRPGGRAGRGGGGRGPGGRAGGPGTSPPPRAGLCHPQSAPPPPRPPGPSWLARLRLGAAGSRRRGSAGWSSSSSGRAARSAPPLPPF